MLSLKRSYASRDTVVIISAIFFRLISTDSANISFLIIAGFALLGLRHAVISLLLVFIFWSLNSGLAPTASFSTIGRFLVLFFAFLSVLIHSRCFSLVKFDKFILITIVMGLFIGLHSLLFSQVIDVSLLKLSYWLVTFITFFGAWKGLSPKLYNKLYNDIYYLLVLVLLISTIFINSPVGYLINGSGFQGVLSHPQTFGVYAAILGSFSVARLLSRMGNYNFDLFVFILSLFLILLSESRTALLSISTGYVMTFIIVQFFVPRHISQSVSVRKFRKVFLVVVATSIISILSNIEYYDYFFSKSGATQTENIVDAYVESRGVLFIPMLKNINENSFGIGFGIASSESMIRITRDPVFNLPISAPIEKGNLYLAVLEELGLIGLLLFFAWLIFSYFRVVKKNLFGLPVFFTILMLNFGESVLFSPGGVGALCIMMFTWSITASKPLTSLGSNSSR